MPVCPVDRIRPVTARGHFGSSEMLFIDLRELLAARGVASVSWSNWRAIDAEEHRRGAGTRRPRVKVVDVAEMLAAAQK